MKLSTTGKNGMTYWFIAYIGAIQEVDSHQIPVHLTSGLTSFSLWLFNVANWSITIFNR